MKSPLSKEDLRKLEQSADSELSDINNSHIHWVNRTSLSLVAPFERLSASLLTNYGSQVEWDESTLRQFAVDVDSGTTRLSDELNTLYLESIGLLARRSVGSLVYTLSKRGVPLELGAAAERAAKASAWFQPQIKSRVARINEAIYNTLVSAVSTMEPKVALARIKNALTIKVGGSDVPGGGLLKSAQRVFVSDSHAVLRSVRMSVFSEAGAQWVYWRLSEGHREHTSAERCEEHATRVLSRDLYEKRGGKGSPDLRGLYPIDGLPDIPHPFCRCWVEPSF